MLSASHSMCSHSSLTTTTRSLIYEARPTYETEYMNSDRPRWEHQTVVHNNPDRLDTSGRWPYSQLSPWSTKQPSGRTAIKENENRWSECTWRNSQRNECTNGQVIERERERRWIRKWWRQIPHACNFNRVNGRAEWRRRRKSVHLEHC